MGFPEVSLRALGVPSLPPPYGAKRTVEKILNREDKPNRSTNQNLKKRKSPERGIWVYEKMLLRGSDAASFAFTSTVKCWGGVSLSMRT